MTKDDIARMAREAGFERVVAIHPDGSKTVTVAPVPELEAFANLVAAAEREACAALENEPGIYSQHDMAEAIRARENT
jgi:hypothetical protein